MSVPRGQYRVVDPQLRHQCQVSGWLPSNAVGTQEPWMGQKVEGEGIGRQVGGHYGAGMLQQCQVKRHGQ